MPLAVAIRLSRVDNEDPLDGPMPFLGPAAGEWLVQAVRDVAPELDRTIPSPDPSSLSPFSVAVLGERGFPASPITLRISALTDELGKILAEDILPVAGSRIELGGLPFNVSGVASRPEQFALAESDSWEELADLLLMPPEGWPAFELLTPGAFDESGRTQAFPLPGLFYGSLLDRWNAFAPVLIPEEVRRFAEECLVPREFDIRSRRTRIGAIAVNGAVGRFSYTLLRRDPYYEAPLAALGRFAFFAGAGIRTAQGLGMTVPRP